MFAWWIAAGCSVGAPPGFSGGDHWTFPLVGPLEDGVLVTPVMVHGHGPYLFAIDPDANVTAVDKQLADELGLRTAYGPRRIDESDTGQRRLYAELLDVKIANLTIDRRDAMMFPPGFYDTEGRHLRGVLGRDAIADSLVFGFDRDQGIATLSTAHGFKPPPDALPIKYESVSSQSSAFVSNVDREQAAGQADGQSGVPTTDVMPVPRRLATAQIGAARFAMHLDLGAATSQLAEAKWDRAGLVRADVQLRLVDEAATSRDVTAVGVAPDVALAGAKTFQVTFAPYVEKRFGDTIDGALGLDFFRPYAVYASWDNRTYFLRLRGDATATLAARLGRWGAALPACPHPGCVTAALGGSGDAVTLEVARDAEAGSRALEVFLGVAPAAGKSAAPLVVELPASAATLSAALPPGYAGATLGVLDVAPFARGCPGEGGCILQVGAASARREAPAGNPAEGGAAAAAVPRNVPLDKLRRLTGDAAIPPSQDVITAVGKPIAVAIVKLCLDADGKVASTRVVKTSGVPAYDDQLRATINASWTFAPTEVDGKPAPVCTTVTFAQH
jgi:hypothetical protein